MRLPADLPAILRARGLSVVTLDGWEKRGRDMNSIDAIVCHHTASSPRASDAAVARLLRDGRTDLNGPLSQLGLQRDGVVVLVAAGRSNHNGYGTYGNDTIGIEAYNDGQGEPWPKVQLDAYVLLVAVLCEQFGVPLDRVLGHKETDPRRKIDPAGIDMDDFRRRVAAISKEDHMTPEESARLSRVEDDVRAIRTALGIRDGMTGMSERKLSTNALARLDWLFEAARDGEDEGPIDLDRLLDKIAERLAK